MARQAQNQQVTQRDNGPPQAVVEFRADFKKMESQFAMNLPAHIPAERFARVAMNAVNRTPRLLMCDRQSLWNAFMQASEDGLLPDKVEGAIVPFKKGKDDDDGSPGQAGDYVAVWIPMVRGIRKLVRQSGEIADLNVQAVYAADPFEYELGDSPFVKHKPMPHGSGDRPIAYYSIASLKGPDGAIYKSFEIMFAAEVHSVAQKSKAFKHGPWSDAIFYPEMGKKTVTKRHFKQLPTSRDLDRVLRRDDALYDFESARIAGDKAGERAGVGRGAAAALAHFAGSGAAPAASGAATDAPPAEANVSRETEASGKPASASNDAGASDMPAGDAGATGKAGAKAPHDPTDPNGADTAAEYEKRFRAYIADAKSADAIDAKWKAGKDVRNKLNLEPEVRDILDKLRTEKAAALRAPAQ